MMIQGLLISKNMIRLVGIVLLCVCNWHTPAYALPISDTSADSSLTILISEQLDHAGRKLPINAHTQRLINYLESELKVKINITLLPWARVLQSGERGQGLIYGISKTAERQRIFNFSDTIFQEKVWLISLCQKQFNYRTMEDLKNKTISISRASSVSEEFDKAVGVLFKVDFDATTTSARFLKLAAHRSDALVFYNSLDAKALEKKVNQEYAKLNAESLGYGSHKLCVINNPIAHTDIHFALSKRLNPELLDRINLALSHAKRKGLIHRFIEDSKK